MTEVKSPLHEARLKYEVTLPEQLKDASSLIDIEGDKTDSLADSEDLQKIFPNIFGQAQIHFSKGKSREHSVKKVGVVLSGGQAPGGHNVIAGLFDALKTFHPYSKVYGFLGGPSGIVENSCIEITKELLQNYRNQGGFDLIGSGRTKIETKEQFISVQETVKELDLDGLVVIGGDDSNTNAALLAEYFYSQGSRTKVVGVPKTIDGDLKSKEVEVSFGFDTACKIYSELIGNILRDCFSAKKYYHFIKLMGRAASHIALECSLQTHPNITIISEEVENEKKTLADITNEIADVICSREKEKKNYGVVLIPEGLIEFIPEMKQLILELNELLAEGKSLNEILKQASSHEERVIYITDNLSKNSISCFNGLPKSIQAQLLEDRDPHGNVQVSRIETEQLLIMTVKEELDRRKKEKRYSGKFSAQNHFFGYEGRSAMPSNFDCNYCYALGYAAALLVEFEKTGYMAVVKGLTGSVSDWKAGGIPLPSMMNLERRHGGMKPVIRKALVNLKDKPFLALKSARKEWSIKDCYRYPGPIQFYGEGNIVDSISLTLQYENDFF